MAAARETWLEHERSGVLTIFQTWDWVSTWYDTMADTAAIDVCAVSVRNADGSPLLFLPLYRQDRPYRGRSASIVDWMAGPLADYACPVLGSRASDLAESELEGVWRTVLDALPPSDLLLLYRQPATIDDRANPLCRLDVRRHATAHLTHLITDSDAYFNARTKASRRADSRRRLRRLAEAGQVELRLVETTEKRLATLDVAIAQKSTRLLATGKSDIFADPGFGRFYRSFTSRHPEQVYMAVLAVAGQIEATVWCARHRGVLYHLLPTFADGPLAVNSTGRLLTEWLLADCCGRSIEVVDFTVGDETYKDEWCEATIPLYRAEIARSLTGHRLEAPVRLKRHLAASPTLASVRQRLRPSPSS